MEVYQFLRNHPDISSYFVFSQLSKEQSKPYIIVGWNMLEPMVSVVWAHSLTC